MPIQSTPYSSQGIRFILRFKLKGVDDNYFKVNLAIYDTDLLVVTGTSYFLWVMDNFKEISNEVLRIWEEENKVFKAIDLFLSLYLNPNHQ